MKQLSLWDYTPTDAEVTPIPLGFGGMPIYYSETGFVLKEPRTLVCEHCRKTWTTIRPEVTEWQCNPDTCFFGNPASFDSTMPEQIEDDDE